MIAIEQIRAARAMLGLTQHDLAKLANISVGTLNNLERGVQTDPKASTMNALRRALEGLGIEFSGEDSGGLGIRLRSSVQAARTIKMLIIDDNSGDRKLYKVWLGKQSGKSYKIIEAGNAKVGYEAFLAHEPACIVLDFMMYGKDGFQLLVEMKKGQIKIPPIIFISGVNIDKVKEKVSDLGVHTYLDKRYLTKEKFCEAVDRALAQSA